MYPLYYVVAVALGLTFGWIFSRTYGAIMRAGATRDYWTGIGRAVRGLLYGDEDQFWQHYFSVISTSVRHISRQLLALALSLAPLIVFTLVIVPRLWPAWHKDAPVVVDPPDAGSIVSRQDNAKAGEQPHPVLHLADGSEISLADPYASHVLCAAKSLGCYVLLGLGFRELENAPGHPAIGENIIVRPYHDDWNPLWPYLNDLEFVFLLSLSVGSIVAFIRQSRKDSQERTTYRIGTLDFMLMELATGGTGFWKRVGDWETKRYGDQLEKLPIERPVFIAGLARSGTTILLETIAGIDGMATHRYRDFPFVMAPILWSRYLSIFGSSQKAVERPHRDKIQITRESPDAFEEPIWQHFFPNLHGTKDSIVLDESTDHPGFEQFYRQHLQKIMFLRKGHRYVSKGNYNVTRVKYLAKLFGDSRFIIPVRNPYTHVRSLMAQHKLFLEYSEGDSRVAEYLRAVGHFEFGPQRMPIAVSRESAEATIAAWSADKEAEGYARQWADVYGYVARMVQSDRALAEKVRIVRFEDFRTDPELVFDSLFRFIELSIEIPLTQVSAHIEPMRSQREASPEDLSQIWPHVADVAGLFGYAEDGRTLKTGSLVPPI